MMQLFRLLFHLKILLSLFFFFLPIIIANPPAPKHGNFSTWKSTAPRYIKNGSFQLDKIFRWFIYDEHGKIVDDLSYDMRGYDKFSPAPVGSYKLINDNVFFHMPTIHYFYFIFEELPLLLSTELHGTWIRFPQNVTIFNCGKDLLQDKFHQSFLDFYFGKNRFAKFPVIQQHWTLEIPNPSIRYYVGENNYLIIPPKLGHYTNIEPWFWDTIRNLKYINHENPSRLIYLTRGQDTRSIVNEHELIKELKKYMPTLEVVYPGNLTFEQQYLTMRDAKLVMGPHGKCLTNLFYAPKNITIVEFGHQHRGNFEFLLPLLSINQSNYYTVKLFCPDPSKIHCNVVMDVPKLLPGIISHLRGRIDLAI